MSGWCLFYKKIFVFADTSSIPTASTFLPIANSLKDLTNKLQTSSIISALPPLFENNPNQDYNVQTDITSVISAEEAYEQSPIRKPSADRNKISEPKITSQDNIDYAGIECFDTRKDYMKKFETDKENSEYDEPILFKHRRRKKNNLVKSNLTTSVTSLSSTSSEERDSHVNRPCMLNVSTIGNLVPDLRSPDSILSDIENKEKLLADMLDLERIKVALENPVQQADIQKTYQQSSNMPVNNFKVYNQQNILTTEHSNKPFNNFTLHDEQNLTKDTNIPEIKDEHLGKQSNLTKETNVLRISDKVKITGQNPALIKNGQINGNLKKESTTHYFEQNSELSSQQNFATNEPVLNYGPPSGSSNPNSIVDPPGMF